MGMYCIKQFVIYIYIYIYIYIRTHPETKAFSQSHENDHFKVIAGQLAEFQNRYEIIYFNIHLSANIDGEIIP